MNKERFLTLLVIALVVLNLVMMGFMFFHKPPRHHGGVPSIGAVDMKYKKGPPLHKVLDFDKEQIVVFHKSKDQLKSTIEIFRSQYDDLSKTYYQSIFKNDSADKAQILQQLNEISNSIFEANLKHFNEIKTICTPDQLPRFEKTMNDMFAHPENKKK